MNWQDKHVLITGASSGIGLALAKLLAKKGASLILMARRLQVLEDIIAQLPNREKHCAVQLDIADSHSVDRAWQTVEQLGRGQVDVLINNAGISQRSLGLETETAVEQRVFATNFFGLTQLTKLVLKNMVEKQNGKIVVMSSIAGKIGFPLRTSYAASKHALHGYFDALRLELHPHNVGVLLVCPGRIRTNISVNAVTASGDAHGEMDKGQAKGISAERCAQKIVSAIDSDRKEIWIGREKIMVYIFRLFPPLFRYLARQISPV